jgi:hypothetical protein
MIGASLASGQLAPQPVSLEATMKFIQDKMYAENGQPVTGENLHRKVANTVTISFKDVESVAVEPMQIARIGALRKLVIPRLQLQ